MLLAGALKLASGGLLLIRSKWLLASVPAWIAAFIDDFLSRNTIAQLPSAFFLIVAMQIGLLYFVVWLHRRGHLKGSK